MVANAVRELFGFASGILRPTIPFVNLSEHELSEFANQIKAGYTEKFPNERRPGNYSIHDWKRVDYVFSQLQGSQKVLDVGVGCGQLVHILSASGRFQEVVGADISRHTRFVKLDLASFDMKYFDVASIPFEDDAFETVICMEVLEHLEQDHFLKAVSELRRVCCGELFMSVPWQEPYPLYRAHKLRFDNKELKTYFPTARYTLLDRGNSVPWMLIRENCQ